MSEKEIYSDIRKGIEFNSESLDPENKVCPHCGSEYEYSLLLARTCKKSGNTVNTYPISKENFCLLGNNKESLKVVVIEPGTIFLNKIGIRKD